MKKRFRWFGLCLFGCLTSVNAAVYKWVDKQGNVHFSQTPPAQEEEVRSSAKVDQRVGANVIEPVVNGRKVFCGRLLVMELGGGDEVISDHIHQNIDDWTRQRQQVDKQRQTDNRLDEQYAEYDCRVRWGYQKLKTFRSFEYQANKQYQNMQQQYDELKARQEEECSTDPKKLGKSMLVGKEANEWGKCYNHYRYKMRDLKARMKQNRKSLRESQP
jgi:hypothetical protein